MNTIFDFVVTLPVTIERKKIETILDDNTHLLKSTLLPVVGDALEYLPSKSFSSPELKDKTKQFFRMTKIDDSKGFFNAIHEAGTKAATIGAELYKLSRTHLPTTLARDNITYKQVAFLQAARALDEFVDYFSSVINYFVIVDTVYKTKEPLSNYANKATIKEISDNWLRFCTLCQMFANEKYDLVKSIKEASENHVEPGNDVAMSEVHGVAKVNPMIHGFVSTRWNPFYAIGMAWVRFLADRHKILEEKKNLFETLLINQQQLANETQDPAIIQRVEQLTLIVEKLKSDLEKSEYRYG